MIWGWLDLTASKLTSIFIRVVIIEWHNIAEPNKLVKCDFILHLKNYQTTCCQVQSTSNQVPKVKFDTAIESLLLIRFPRLCNRFTSTTLSKMIRFGICKDQNDLSHTAQHAEPPGGHIWSHFDWKFQSRRYQSQADGALGNTSGQSDFSFLAWDGFSQIIGDLF